MLAATFAARGALALSITCALVTSAPRGARAQTQPGPPNQAPSPSTSPSPPASPDAPPSTATSNQPPSQSLAQTASGAGSFAPPITDASQGRTRSSTKAILTVGGYVEAFYQWNFDQPGNGVTNDRAFDARHNEFAIQNAVLDTLGAIGPVAAHLALQVGLQPAIYYRLGESSAQPSLGLPGGPVVSSTLWQYLQQANIGYNAPLGRGLLLEAGLFLSPIGPEGMAVKDQWNWSRSDLFYALPYYHVGVRVTYPVTDRLTLSLQAYNGWNHVVDNNGAKSLAGQLTYAVPDRVTVNLLYFTGVERDESAPEGQPWRHLFDAWVALYPTRWLSLLGHVDGGFEPNRFGTSWWAAGAAYVRAQATRVLFLAARGDYFYEHVPGGDTTGYASPIFFPVSWVASDTLTLEVRPVDNLSARLEYRHDQAAGDLYFKGATAPPNAVAEDTITVGATTWF